jgi:RpiB/LacA/LacB family sugar-phosphate isomerase
MQIAIGSDHAGFELKQHMNALRLELGHQVSDLGTHTVEAADYLDYAERVALALCTGHALRGIVICGNGVRASVAANKIAGVRAGLCHDTYSARQGVEHDDMNVLILRARVIGVETARELVRAFVTAPFNGEERHQRRLAKVAALERRYGAPIDFKEGERA